MGIEAALRARALLKHERRKRRLAEVEGVHQIVRLAILRGRIKARERRSIEHLLDEARDRRMLSYFLEDEPGLGVGRNDDQRQSEAEPVGRRRVATVLP